MENESIYNSRNCFVPLELPAAGIGLNIYNSRNCFVTLESSLVVEILQSTTVEIVLYL